MRTLILAAALVGAATAPGAQDAAASVDAMTCGEFLALGEPEQMDAMLALRASYNGEPAPEPMAEAAPAVAEDDGTADADVTAEGEDEAPMGSPRLTGMRTSCEGGPDVLALDAMLAAHADYD